MSYVATPPKFEAVQWTGTGFAAYKATVDPADMHGVMLNSDNSVSYDFAVTMIVEVNGWLVSNLYYGAFPGWDAGALFPPLTDADFQAQYAVSV